MSWHVVKIIYFYM